MRECVSLLNERGLSAIEIHAASRIAKEYYRLRYSGDVPQEIEYYSLEEEIHKFRDAVKGRIALPELFYLPLR